MPRSRRDRERAEEQDSYSFDLDPVAPAANGVQLNPDGTPCRACTSVQDVKQRLGDALSTSNSRNDCAPDVNQIGNAGWVSTLQSSS